MNSDLIVMSFDSSERAETVYSSLLAMRKSQILGLDDSVLLTKDGAGQFSMQPGSQVGNGLAGLLADMILRYPAGVVPAPGGVKLDSGFVGAVRSALRNNDSALLFFLHADSLSDARELLNTLALFRGTIHQTTLCPRSEALLRGML